MKKQTKTTKRHKQPEVRLSVLTRLITVIAIVLGVAYIGFRLFNWVRFF
jgi:flagellar biogenesis protein FliO